MHLAKCCLKSFATTFPSHPVMLWLSLIGRSVFVSLCPVPLLFMLLQFDLHLLRLKAAITVVRRLLPTLKDMARQHSIMFCVSPVCFCHMHVFLQGFCLQPFVIAIRPPVVCCSLPYDLRSCESEPLYNCLQGSLLHCFKSLVCLQQLVVCCK